MNLHPHRLEKITNVNNKQCSDGTKVLDIDDEPHLFKPTSYKYMAHWTQNGWWGDSADDIIILTPIQILDAIDKYNKRIDFLVACGDGCTSALSSCKSICKNTCPPCDHGIDDDGNPYTDCSAKYACYASCDSSCDGAIGSCKGICNDCEDDQESQCLSDSVDVFPYK